MNKKRIRGRILCFAFALLASSFLWPLLALGSQPVFDTDYLQHPDQYQCEFTSGHIVEDTDDHYVIQFLEYVYGEDPTMPIDNKRLVQSRTLTYTFDGIEKLTGQPARYSVITEYPDGWSNTYFGWWTEFRVYGANGYKTEAELLEALKESYFHPDRGQTCEETSAGGRKGLKITSKKRTAPAPLHHAVTNFDEDVQYLIVLDSPLAHTGFVYMVVSSTAHGAATHYQPMKPTTEAQLDVYYSDYVSRFDAVIGALCGAPFTVEESDVWVAPPVNTPAKDEEDKKGISKEINTDAQKTSGESGFSVPAAIVLGVAAAGAAAAGAGAAAAGEGAGEAEQAGSYAMVIGKDFGDAIKFGKKRRVWARMTELRNGVSVDRPDLTGEISIFSNEILVGAASMSGSGMAAEVQIQEKAPPQGVISFRYSGPDGYFQNNVRFKLLGKGEIKLAADKVSILATDSKPFELVYELKNFEEEEPPLEITASSGFVRLDLGKNDKDQTVILLSPGPDAQEWDHKKFTQECECEITAMDDKLPVKAAFKVTVCFEGIGTAYEKLPIDEIEKDALVQCFTEAEKEKREEKALWIPLTVMKWNEKNRTLEPDPAKAGKLTWTYAVHPDFEFKTPESKALAERVVSKAKLEAKALSAPAALKTDAAKKPAAYRVMASADPDEGAAPFDIRMTVGCEGDAMLAPLALTAQIQPNPDFKGMVRWFLEYPLGSAVADFITLGNVATYHGALDFIESRVYPMSGVPWSSNLLWNKSGSSHYETGRGDIMRKSYIAIKDDSYPTSLENFKKVQTLVHELTHVIEDQHGDYNVDAKSERHAYYLQHLSDVARGLADLEDPSTKLLTNVWYAINWLTGSSWTKKLSAISETSAPGSGQSSR
jgi:hypothetical protein